MGISARLKGVFSWLFKSWPLKVLSSVAVLCWVVLGTAAAQPGGWDLSDEPSDRWLMNADGYLGSPSRTGPRPSINRFGFATYASNERGQKASQIAGKAERAAGETPSSFKDPTPRYPDAPDPSEPSLTGDFRVCPTMNHASCQSTNLGQLARKHGALDGKTIVLAPGRYKKLRIKNAKNVTILCEPGAWFGRLESEQIGGGISMTLSNADGARIEGCHFQRNSRGIALGDTVTATIVNNSFSNHVMHLQAHSAKNNPNNALGTGQILIADNLFFGTLGKRIYSHGLYLSGGLGGNCEIIGNRMLRFSSLGNGLKLGCAKGLVEDNQVLMLDGSGSVALDIVKGGEWVVRSNVFQSGPNRDNSNMASLAVSKRRDRGGVWEPERHDTQFLNNTWILDGGEKKGCVLKGRSPGPISFDGDRLVGFQSTCGKASDVLGVNVVWSDVEQPRPKLMDGEPLLESARVVDLIQFKTRNQAGMKPYRDQAQFADQESPYTAN